MTQPRFLLDEHVWGRLVKVGQQLGVDIELVQTKLTKGADDERVLVLAAEERRILLTSNARDFVPLAVAWFLDGREHWGIVFVPGQTDAGLLVRALRNIVERYSAESFQNTVRFVQEFG